MSSTPLESFFNENHPRPQAFYMYGTISTCWRGYIGEWRIENDFLYLERLRYGFGKDQDEIPLSLMFKEDLELTQVNSSSIQTAVVLPQL